MNEPRQSTVVLGVDLGGTKTGIAVASTSGSILHEEVTPTRSSGEDPVQRLRTMVERTLDRAGRSRDDVVAACIGVPGVVDPATRRISGIPYVRELEGTDGAELLEPIAKATVRAENDVNLAALGEWSSLADPPGSLAVLALGTGAGLGLVRDGQLVRGEHGAAGELALLPLGGDPFDHRHREAPLEAVVSTEGLMRLFRLHSGRAVSSGAEIVSAWARGDADAAFVMDAYALTLPSRSSV